jgi:dTDP-4-dehydrorhamnose 3,5-epimerase
MRVLPTDLPGVLLVEPTVVSDARGFFVESWQRDRFAAAGIAGPFVQDNHSRSAPWTLRGLHAQLRQPQGKLVRAVEGEIFDVAVDIRRGSPTFGRWAGALLSAENFRQLWVPPGFAHGFLVTRGPAQVLYKATDFYAREDEIAIAWSDPAIGIAWPLPAGVEPVVSEKDRMAPALAELAGRLPVYPAAAAE